MVRVLAVCLACASVMMTSSAQAQAKKAGGGASPLFQNMQATGKPALIIAGSVDCVYCREMAQELANVPELQPLVRNLFVVKVDVASPDWPVLRQTFQFEENGIPAVFWVRADGQLLYSDAGKPRDLQKFLTDYLGKSGTILDDKTLKELARDAKQADLALKRKDYAKVASVVQAHRDTGSFAAAALLLHRLGEQLLTEAQARVSAAQEQLQSPEHALAGVLALHDLQDQFGDAGPAREAIDAALEALSADADADRQPLLDQAELLAPARQDERARRWKAAAEKYQRLVADAPTSPAGQYAARQLQMLAPRLK